MIARASGAYASLPVPSFSAIGIRPMIVASDVISTGRSRTRQAVATASRTASPSSISRCVNSTMRMLFDTTMPTIITTPISDCTFSVVPVRVQREQHAGQSGGTASRMMNGSMNDRNCATRIR